VKVHFQRQKGKSHSKVTMMHSAEIKRQESKHNNMMETELENEAKTNIGSTNESGVQKW